jgi:hydrogenase expression/formation protein HypD
MPDATPALVNELHRLARAIGRPLQVMEVCGTHTVAVFRNGLRSLLPESLRLVSGPGCPVCVTAQRYIDAAVQLSRLPDVLIATYGDMVRVPGRLGSLERQRALGADVRVVNSTLSAVHLAEKFRARQVVFLAVGFETTAPATAAALIEAQRKGIENFTVLAAHKLVVPAMLALLEGGDVPLDGFLCPGHVSVIIGSEAYRPVVERYHIPCTVAGFEPVGILTALASLLGQIHRGEARVENAYDAAVTPLGNGVAQRLMDEVFCVSDTPWRALGVIRDSGLELRPAYQTFDALKRFGIQVGEDVDDPACRCGEVIQGKIMPDECPLFGAPCTPLDPLGPCMVSSEGTCSAWFKYGCRAGYRTPVGAGV